MATIKLVNPPITKIEDDLYLGDSVASRRRAILQENNITAVLSISDGGWVHWRSPWYKEIVHEGDHLFVPCNDSMTQDMLPLLKKMCDFIDSNRQLQSGESQETKNVLVHCDRGISRSPTALIAYLMRTNKRTYDETLAFVSEKRKIKPNENFKEQLRVWEAVNYEIWADEEKTMPKPEYAEYLAKRAERLKECGLTGNEPIGIQNL